MPPLSQPSSRWIGKRGGLLLALGYLFVNPENRAQLRTTTLPSAPIARSAGAAALIYKLPVRGRFILIRPAVIELMDRFRQRGSDDPEAGGVLIGIRKKGGHIEVMSATEPMPGDNRKLFSFSRDIYGHKEKADDAWLASMGVHHYMGEWHSHAEDQPSPSFLDRLEWRKLVRHVKPLPLVAVIVGRVGLWVGVVDQKGIKECRSLQAAASLGDATA